MIDKKRFGEMVEQFATPFRCCLWPSGPQCTSRAIKAHSIQNAQVLDLLCEDDHVIMFHPEMDIDTGPSVIFMLIGRNKATTFTGLCDTHDAQLFRPIDTAHFDPRTPEQPFLLAYRAVLRELHSKMKAAIDVQTQYASGVKDGRFDPNVADAPQLKATSAMFEAWSFYRYKCHYDEIYLSGDFSRLGHSIEYVDDLLPSIAVSSVYSYIDNMKLREDRLDPKCIVLNVFPYQTGYCVLFSYIPTHKGMFAPHLSEIFSAPKPYKLYLLSKLVLMHCENLVLSPAFLRQTSPDNQDIILSFFARNIGIEKVDADNPALYLFLSGRDG